LYESISQSARGGDQFFDIVSNGGFAPKEDHLIAASCATFFQDLEEFGRCSFPEFGAKIGDGAVGTSVIALGSQA
jgi:hypothetical protein